MHTQQGVTNGDINPDGEIVDKIADLMIDMGFDSGGAFMNLSDGRITVSTVSDHATVTAALQAIGAVIDEGKIYLDGCQIVLSAPKEGR
jgi:hypothetical protein